MMGLWADGWFYISSAGLLISGILFFFLLGQYRVASEAADATEGAEPSEAVHVADKEASAPAAIRPVYIPEASSSPKVASHAEAPEPKQEPKPEPKPRMEPEFTGPERRKDPANTTGGISPAVVYLQNIKVELADLHKDLRALSKRVDDELSSVSTRDEALIERLGELTRAVEAMKAAAPAPAPAAEPAAEAEEAPKPARKARKAEKPPEPAPEVVVEAPTPAAEVVLEAPKPEAEVSIEVLPPPPVEAPPPVAEVKAGPSPDETIRMELGALVSPPPVKAEPEAPAAAEPAKEEAPPVEKPRRGPVWPV
ncbi:MAG: hypothetical protein HYX59_08195 [Elusimicrobia bacterium]|nr:hypothetical protein [Elusimicrobiota bacterium]